MPRKQPSGLTRFFRNFIRQTFAGPARTSDRKSQRRLKFESLEGRQLLASDLGAITGIVSTDSPIEGATVNLYADDGDGVFEPGGDDGAATANLTDATGRYRFDRLAAGGYWIEQPAQTVGSDVLGLFVSPLITIDAATAAGTAGTVIDDFADTPAASVTADLLTSPNFLAADHAGALGGERDMIVTLTSGLTLPSVTLSSAGNMLVFDSSADAQGQFNVIYDGNDDDASALAATGLGGIDLTQSGVNTAVKVRAQADQLNSTVRLRVYTDAVNFSDSAAIVIPDTNTPEDFVFHFSQFTSAGGTGADFTNVGAIDLLIETNTNATDGIVTVLGAFAPIAVTQDIDNEIDLSVTKTVNDPTPAVGQDVTFTITVTNPAGGPQATGIVVTDDLPTGLTFVSASTVTGSYDENTDLWTIGSLDAGETATLDIVATVTTGSPVLNTASITTADQPDTNVANNTDDETVDAVATADLSLVKDVSNAAPNLNSDVTFTLTLTNAGPDDATGVQVTDLLPAGLTFVSATPSGTSTYDEITGIWDVGTVDTTTPATLSIVATVTSLDPIDNIAEVTAANEADPDSTPNNNVPAEDDQDNAVVDAVSADLSLTKDVDDPTPNLGQDVTFTLTLTNSGPDDATGVQVTDLLPTGLAFVSATPSGTSTYDEITGIWDVGAVDTATPATLILVATVNSTAAITNTAEVTASDVVDPDSTPGDGQGDDFDTVLIDAAAAADLSLTKVASSLTPSVGSDVTFTLTLTNSGPDDATGVIVTDLLPTGLTFVSATPSGTTTYDETTGIWDVGTLDTLNPATLQIVATVTSAAPIVNSAEVTASDVFDPDSTPNDGQGDDFDSETIDAPNSADLSLTKDVNNPTPNLGQQVTFTLTLTNSGPDDATGVVVTDLLPAGLTFVGATPSGTSTYDEITGVWDVGTVDTTTPATLSIVATVNSTAAITNTAEVTASDAADPDSIPGDGQGDDFNTVVVDAAAAADLALTKTASSLTPSVGSDVTFTLTLTNSGPDDATGVIVTDLLPTGLTFVSAAPSGTSTYDETTGVWDVGTLSTLNPATLQIVATVTSTAAIVNSAEVTASDVFDPDSTPNDGQGDDFDSETIDAPNSADLSLSKSASSLTPSVGSNVTFTLTLTNSGPDDATGVQVTDLLPTGLTFVSATPSGTSTYDEITGVWDVGAVTTATPATLAIVATVNSSTAIVNTAQVTASGTADPDSTPNDGQGDDFATVTIDAPAAADLSVTKSATSTTPNLGSNVTFTVTVANAGPDQATGVVVTDLLPAGLVFVSSTPSQGSYVASTGVWTVGTINNASSATLSIVARVDSTAALNNVAQVTASGVPDPDSTPNDGQGDDFATITIDAPSAADLRLAKTIVGPQLVNVGQNLTFRLTLNNDGPDQATGVSVTDQLPAGLTFVSATASQGTYDSGTGVWTVGSVNNGASATLDIVATLTTPGAKTNTASISASTEFDPDTADRQATVGAASVLLSKRRFLARPHL